MYLNWAGHVSSTHETNIPSELDIWACYFIVLIQHTILEVDLHICKNISDNICTTNIYIGYLIMLRASLWIVLYKYIIIV